jgi:3-oxoacyl-[acyl-carrier protein] reductase
MMVLYFSATQICMTRLQGKIALVTGANRGIGKAIALQFAREGCSVILHYGSNDLAADEISREILATGQEVFKIKTGLSTLAGIRELFLEVDKFLQHKKIDILVNNAGILYRAGLDDITEDQYDALFNVNVKAPFFITREAIARMNDGGRIINLSSQVSKRPRYNSGAYSMTKAAIENFTVSLAKELGKRKITVNALAPGFIDTEMNKGILSTENERSAIAAKAALNRVGVPEDVARVATFLASDESGWVTAQCIEVSGGAGLF